MNEREWLEILVSFFERYAILLGLIAAVFSFVAMFLNRPLKADLEREAQALEQRVATASTEAGEAIERAGMLEKEAAILKAKNLQLEAAISPRRLDDRQTRGLSSLSRFAGQTVGVRSYSSDTEGFLIATQILEALARSGLGVEDNRLTIQPAGSLSFGVSVEGPNQELVAALKGIFSMAGSDLTAPPPSPSQMARAGVSARVEFGVRVSERPPAATITIGPKPLK